MSVVAGIATSLLVAATASATVLCQNNESASACNTPYVAETEIAASLASGTKAKLKTEFKTVECSKSTVSGKTETTGDETETVKGPVEALTFAECNCTVSVVSQGSLELHWISGGNNGTVTSTGAEVTSSCSTIFGTVHCIYATSNTDLGTLTGGKPATIDVSAEVVALTTSGLCSEKGTWEATYTVTKPEPLYVTANTNTVLCEAEPTEVAGTLECPAKKAYFGQVVGSAWPKTTPRFSTKSGETISCTKETFEGSFATNGKSEAGVTVLAFETANGTCTSTLTNKPNVRVEFPNLSFDQSRFKYDDPKPANGTFKIGKTAANPELLIEIVDGVNTICRYEPSYQVSAMSNWEGLGFLSLSIGWSVKPKEPAKCPATLEQEALTDIRTFGGKTSLYIAGK